MPVDFDEEDLSGVVEETMGEPAPPELPVQEQDLESQMSEVEARFEVAQYYRLLLNDSLFQDPPNPSVANRVETEIRAFIKTRMQALMGIAVDAPGKIFSDSEVQVLRTLAQPDVSEALKALAAKVLKKPAILDAKPLAKAAAEPKREPTLRKVVSRPKAALKAPAPTGKQQRRIETHVTEEGKEIVRDLTPQARPTGTIQPIPTPRGKQQIEAAAAGAAAYQSRVALRNLEKTLLRPPVDQD